MPIYEYECADCGRKFEVLVKIGEKNPPLCPGCGKNRTYRLFSVFGFKSEGRTSSSSCASCTATSCNGCTIK